jgi:hypothetical protein
MEHFQITPLPVVQPYTFRLAFPGVLDFPLPQPGKSVSQAEKNTSAPK